MNASLRNLLKEIILKVLHCKCKKPRKRGKGKNDKKKRGISKEQICIETAIDRKGNILMGAVCNGRITTNQIVNFFDNKICEEATFCDRFT